jgi:hypothetical protein
LGAIWGVLEVRAAANVNHSAIYLTHLFLYCLDHGERSMVHTMEPLQIGWQTIQKVGAIRYICGFCNQNVASENGWFSTIGNINIRVCPYCQRPTFFEREIQFPGVAFGDTVKALPRELETLYEEARRSCSVNAYTAVVLCCRKLLMNIAVGNGAKEGLKFIEYVEYLADKGFVPPNGKSWVDHIRTKGNEATHEIALMDKATAEDLIAFSEMLLKFIYEFPSRVPQSKSVTP